MEHMFRDATAFNGDISGWDVMAVTYKKDMFTGAIAMTEVHTPCTATGLGADGKTTWRTCD